MRIIQKPSSIIYKLDEEIDTGDYHIGNTTFALNAEEWKEFLDRVRLGVNNVFVDESGNYSYRGFNVMQVKD